MSELHVDSVSKSFGVNQVLTDIFISCKPGDIIGLLGRNGGGKSTLLKIVFGALKADNKFVRIDGKMVSGLCESKGMIAYLPQNNFLPGHLKISTIVELFCKTSEVDDIKSNQHVAPFLNKRSNELSGGERRMVEILLIIHATAKYILIDEPFNGVAPIYKDDVKRLVQEHSREKGFVITDHDHMNIMDIATKIILLQDGCTREIKTKDELVYWGYMPGGTLKIIKTNWAGKV